ncbi:WD40-repeat-containing domain protein [Bisporella sp. PMI_857]|nr:WD40-repeat-containing domain protein [Bisporella sp. PMI_857]
MRILISSPIPCINDRTVAVRRLAWSDAYASVALSDTSVHVYSLMDGSHKLSFQDPCGKVVLAHAIVDDKVIVGSADGALRAWHILEGTNLHTIRPSNLDPSKINSLHVISPSSNPPSILAAAADGTIRRWIIGSDSYSQEFLGGHCKTVFRMQSYDNGNRFVSAAWEGTISAWDLSSRKNVWKVKQDGEVYSFTIGEGVVIVGRRNGVIKVLKLEDGLREACHSAQTDADINGLRTEIAAIEAHEKVVNGLLVYQNRLISTGADGFAKVWLVSASKELYTFERGIRLYDHAVTSRCLLGPWLISAGKDGGGEENVCGLENRMKACRIDGTETNVLELGMPVVKVWSIATLEGVGKTVLILMKKGKPTLEILDASSIVG